MPDKFNPINNYIKYKLVKCSTQKAEISGIDRKIHDPNKAVYRTHTLYSKI